MVGSGRKVRTTALSALPMTMLDRSRDRLQQLDELTRGRFGPTLAALDRLLAGTRG